LEAGRLGPKLLALFAIALGTAMVIRAAQGRCSVWVHSRWTRKDLGAMRRQALQ
jgi:hypothetical protein